MECLIRIFSLKWRRDPSPFTSKCLWFLGLLTISRADVTEFNKVSSQCPDILFALSDLKQGRKKMYIFRLIELFQTEKLLGYLWVTKVLFVFCSSVHVSKNRAAESKSNIGRFPFIEPQGLFQTSGTFLNF